MSIKLITIEQGRRETLKAIRKILRNYNSIEFSLESERDIYTKEEIGKIIIIKLSNR